MGSSSTSTSSPSSPKEEVTPEEAHQIAQELAERFFPGCEVLVATHMDTEHLHSHLIVNSVHPDTGKKLHFTPNTLEQMRKVSDQICMEHGLTTLKPYQQDRRTQGLRTGEYRAANRGDSWKFQLIITIEEAMKRAGTREEFLREMNQLGYQVRWEEGRKSITYTTPTGKKCRDDKLHELKFRKGQMEHEFRIRQRAAQQFTGHSETEAEELTHNANLDRPAGQHPLHHANPNRGAAGTSPAEHPGPPGEYPERDGFPCHQKELGAAGYGRPAGPMAKPDEGSHQGMCQDLEKVQRGIQEENRQAGKQRDEFMRQLSTVIERLRRDGEELQTSFRLWAATTIMCSVAGATAASILVWRILG